MAVIAMLLGAIAYAFGGTMIVAAVAGIETSMPLPMGVLFVLVGCPSFLLGYVGVRLND